MVFTKGGLPGINSGGRIAEATRRAMGIPTLEDGGLTDGECIVLFCSYSNYVTEIRYESRPLVNTPGSTESPADDCDTGISSDSGSTAATSPS
jgi:hypothetical protein